MSNERIIQVTVCVGSSCHIKGARTLITRLNDLLHDYDLLQQVELKGSFCMERCGEGVNWQIDDETITSATIEEAIGLFHARVIVPIRGRVPQEGNR